MNFSDIFARVVALTGGTALLMRRLTEGSHEPAWGSSPAIPVAKPQGSIPTLKMPTARGWTEGQTPVAAPGLTVNAYFLCRQYRWPGRLPLHGRCEPDYHAGTKARGVQARRTLDAEPAAQPRWAEALHRGRLVQQYRREWHVRRGRPSPIHEFDLASGQIRIFAGGLRHAVGMAWEPETGALWTVVNERDGLGDETPPDYLTSVRDGGFYDWPYCYWGQTADDRVPQDPAAVAKAITPDYALGGHTASLGLCWLPAGTLPGFPDGMATGQHGSWNRSKLSGYKVVFVPFANGRPVGPPRDILTGFLAPDERVSYERPVGMTIDPDGSLLVADDVGNVLWRVTGKRQR